MTTDLNNRIELQEHIRKTFCEVYAGRKQGAPPQELQDDMVLLDSGLDSLGFAILGTILEDELNYDPFSISTEAYYPRTFGEFVDFYYKNRPQ
jgi:acyl carrier protein